MVPAGFTPLHDFLDSLHQTDWFGHLGEDMSSITTGIAETYLRSLKQTTALIKIARSWDEAKAAANSAESRAAHSVDEARDRQFLREQAANIHSPELCTTWLNLAFENISNIAYGITTGIPSDIIATSRDVFLTKAAAGAFAEAAYDNTLWLLAQEREQHSVHLKFALFQQGRWPIGIKGQSFYIL